MCLALPLTLIEVHNQVGLAERDGVKIEIDLSLVPEAKIGDSLIVHVGIALSVLDSTDGDT
jgi:hydrogenase expression/formation protein HypC